LEELLARSPRFEATLRKHEPLARYTAARLGGPADWVYLAKHSTDDLVEVVKTAWAHDIPVRVLGAGANVLVSDQGVRGLVVINSITEVEMGDWHDGRNLAATAGTSLTILSRRCASFGLSGMEWAVGVPGSVGGAVVNNAGAHGGAIGDSVGDVVVLEADRGVQRYAVEDLHYAYRTSMLKARADRRFLVLLATLRLTPDDPEAIQERMNEFNAYRKRTQPQGASLGSIFKNPPGDYAGRLIELAGLKGYRIGEVQISPVHANFIVNTGGSQGSASDYYALVRHVQTVVHETSGVHLEPEIEFIGQWDV
jgi:UDP-N-acetylmuramate dehydrogenase